MIWHRLTARLTRALACREFVEVVTDYLDGAMSARERARFEHHLSRCDGCDHYLAQIRRTVDLTGRLTVADVDALGSDARERLLGAFREFHTQGA
jgi:anti-sigma factor RsiW